jgi:hypothetical protein
MAAAETSHRNETGNSIRTRQRRVDLPRFLGTFYFDEF